mmetsp:Transcript_63644/g.163833  ORF Transcript_63644/g.163833 Transcript_63644/m.163833 type:complete len:213 (+) Transcript_63644:226-864(+)
MAPRDLGASPRLHLGSVIQEAHLDCLVGPALLHRSLLTVRGAGAARRGAEGDGGRVAAQIVGHVVEVEDGRPEDPDWAVLLGGVLLRAEGRGADLDHPAGRNLQIDRDGTHKLLVDVLHLLLLHPHDVGSGGQLEPLLRALSASQVEEERGHLAHVAVLAPVHARHEQDVEDLELVKLRVRLGSLDAARPLVADVGEELHEVLWRPHHHRGS